MNKNIIIGALIVIVVVGAGYFLMKDKNITVQDDTTQTPNTVVTQNDTQTTKPSAPTVTTSSINSTSSSTANITGQINPNGAATIYWFEYGETTSLGTKSTVQALGSGYSTMTATGFISGLKANTQYYYRISALNDFGTVNGALYTLQTNSATPPKVVKATVHTSSATEIESTTAVINGEVNTSGIPTSYWYEYGKTTSLGFVTSLKSTNAGTSLVSAPTYITNLEPATKYYFRLNAQNQFGTVNGSILNFTTGGSPVSSSSKPVVETSSAKNVDSTSAVLTGKINPNGAETTYWFEYSVDSLLGTLVTNSTSQKMVFSGTTNQVIQSNISGLLKNTKYYYHLIGENKNGTTNGEIMSFTTKK